MKKVKREEGWVMLIKNGSNVSVYSDKVYPTEESALKEAFRPVILVKVEWTDLFQL